MIERIRRPEQHAARSKRPCDAAQRRKCGVPRLQRGCIGCRKPLEPRSREPAEPAAHRAAFTEFNGEGKMRVDRRCDGAELEAAARLLTVAPSDKLRVG